MSTFNRFLGDTPLRVAAKLIIVSFLVGIVMATFGWSPLDILYSTGEFFRTLWETGFEAIYRFWHYFILGAAVVIPAFIILRLISYRK